MTVTIESQPTEIQAFALWPAPTAVERKCLARH
jgi:hypothetical protein